MYTDTQDIIILFTDLFVLNFKLMNAKVFSSASKCYISIYLVCQCTLILIYNVTHSKSVTCVSRHAFTA